MTGRRNIDLLASTKELNEKFVAPTLIPETPDTHASEEFDVPEKDNRMMRPSMAMRVFFEGYRTRPLHKVHGISRIEFLRRANKLMKNVESEVRAEGGSEEEVRNAYIATFKRLAEGSLFYFCVAVLKMDYVNNDYGYRLCQDVQENKWNRMWIIAREHLKSQIITCASTLWETLKDPERTTCIYSYKEDMARVFLILIKSWCENCFMIRALWPEVMWENPGRGYEDIEIEGEVRRYNYTWTSSALEFKRKSMRREMTIEIGGIEGSSKTGYHFSHQVFDDIETARNVETPEAIDKITTALEMALNTGQTENMNIAIVGTFYAKDDAYCRFIKKGETLIREAIIQPCFDYDGTPIRFSMEAIYQKFITAGPKVFAEQWLLDITSSSAASFREDWLHFWDPSPKGLNVYLVVDPAGNRPGRRMDFTAMIVFGKDALGNLKILDMKRDKLTFEKKFSTLASLVFRWRPKGVYYEQFSVQDDISAFQVLMDDRNVHFPITKFNCKSDGSKDARIERTIPYFANGRIWIPETCKQVNYLGDVEDVVQTFIRDEYRGYPNIAHDDMLDVIASAVILDQRGYFERPMGVLSAEDDRWDRQTRRVYEPADFCEVDMAYAEPY